MRGNFLIFPFTIQNFRIFALPQSRKAKRQTYLRKGVVLTLYLRLVESRKFQPHRVIKQWPTPMYSHIPSFVYTIERGLSALLIFGERQCESLTGGMSNSSYTRASFSVFFEYNHQIQNGFGVWGVSAGKRKEKRNEETFITYRFVLCLIDDDGARCDCKERWFYSFKQSDGD